MIEARDFIAVLTRAAKSQQEIKLLVNIAYRNKTL
jgi:hypothetical protein